MQIIEIAQEKTNMAILKHIASKNADYGETERYLIFQHDEYTQKPILVIQDLFYQDAPPSVVPQNIETTRSRD